MVYTILYTVPFLVLNQNAALFNFPSLYILTVYKTLYIYKSRRPQGHSMLALYTGLLYNIQCIYIVYMRECGRYYTATVYTP